MCENFIEQGGSFYMRKSGGNSKQLRRCLVLVNHSASDFMNLLEFAKLTPS